MTKSGAWTDLLAEAKEALNALQNVRDYLLKHSHRLPPMSSTGCEVRIEKLSAAIAKIESPMTLGDAVREARGGDAPPPSMKGYA